MTSLAVAPAQRGPVPDAAFHKVLRYIAGGQTIRGAIKRMKDLGERAPSRRYFLAWVDKSPEREHLYTQAIRSRVRLRMDDLVETAKRAGKRNGVDVEDPGMFNALVQRQRLIIDTEKWAASKLCPREFGDKLQHEHTGNVSVNVVTHVPDGVSNKSNRIGYAAGSILDDESPALGITDAVDAAYTLRTTVDSEDSEDAVQAAPLTCAQARALDRAARAGSMLDD